MTVTKVCCQGCGADLQINEGLRYVTCNYCHSKLEIVHDATVTHTRQLDKIEQTTELLAKKLKVMELHNDVENLDREWEKFRKAVLARDEHGQVSELSAGADARSGVVGIIFGIPATIFFASIEKPVFILIGIGVIGFSIFCIKRGLAKAEVYQTQKARYEIARQNLVRRLNEARE